MLNMHASMNLPITLEKISAVYLCHSAMLAVLVVAKDE